MQLRNQDSRRFIMNVSVRKCFASKMGEILESLPRESHLSDFKGLLATAGNGGLSGSGSTAPLLKRTVVQQGW
jgi:hypothetical protein